ncbi:tRNA-dihydrouridine synthase family protein [Candidatus Woesearchaeota archaeon]|nr:tRNA-dihydrouridine synthase family protein [Candidatus Woesearchaeota archaeon]
MYPTLSSRFILAPLANINDIAFRRLCKERGAAMVCIGLISAEALIRGNDATFDMIQTCEEERPVAIQLFGQDPDVLAKAVPLLEPYADVIDFNMGCPDKHVMQQGCGSTLLLEEQKVVRLLTAMRGATKKPLTAKIRIGIDYPLHDEILSLVVAMESTGIDALAIHARTASQGYSGHAYWQIMKEIKEKVRIPVIGSGDVRNMLDARRMIEETGVDYVMIGRAAMGNPNIFAGKDVEQLTLDDIKTTYSEYLRYAEQYGIEKFAYLRMKGQLFFKGFEGAGEMRAAIGKTASLTELLKLLSRSN